MVLYTINLPIVDSSRGVATTTTTTTTTTIVLVVRLVVVQLHRKRLKSKI